MELYTLIYYAIVCRLDNVPKIMIFVCWSTEWTKVQLIPNSLVTPTHMPQSPGKGKITGKLGLGTEAYEVTRLSYSKIAVPYTSMLNFQGFFGLALRHTAS